MIALLKIERIEYAMAGKRGKRGNGKRELILNQERTLWETKENETKAGVKNRKKPN